MTTGWLPSRYEGGMACSRCGRSGLWLPAISLGLWHNRGGDGRAVGRTRVSTDGPSWPLRRRRAVGRSTAYRWVAAARWPTRPASTGAAHVVRARAVRSRGR
jgi:hypothetical protein